MEKRLLSNIWKYTLFLITNKRVWVAVIAVYYLTIPGVNALGISYILMAGNFAGFIFEIPSGYIADRFGHKNTIILSRVFAVIGSLFYLIAGDLPSLIIGSIFLSLANAFFSGTGSAFMHDTLMSLNKDKEYGKIMGKVKSLGFAIPLIISTTIPFFTIYGMRVPFVVGLIMDIIGLVISFTFVSPTAQSAKVEEVSLNNFKGVVSEGLKLGYLKYALYSSIIGGLLFAIGSFRGPFQEAAGVAVIWFGIFFGAGRILAAILLWNTHRLQKLLNLSQFYFWQTVVFVLIFFVLGLSSNPWLVVILFAMQNGLKWGLSEIEDSYLLPVIRESKNKATLLSVGAQMEDLFGGIVSPVIGWMILTYNYQIGMLYFAILLLSMTLPLYYLIFIRKLK